MNLDALTGQAQAVAQQPQSEQQPISLVRQMLKLAQQYGSVEPDEEDKSEMAQIFARLQKLLAKDQQDTSQVLGNQTVQRVLRKSG